MSPDPDVQIRLATKVRPLLEARQLSARLLSSILGTVIYLAPLVPRGFVHLRPLLWLVKLFWSPAAGFWSDRVTLTREVMEKLQWWLTPQLFAGVAAVWLAASATITTDASLTGWGATLADQKAYRVCQHPQLSWHIMHWSYKQFACPLRVSPVCCKVVLYESGSTI